jgi:hypothetical protein
MGKHRPYASYSEENERGLWNTGPQRGKAKGEDLAPAKREQNKEEKSCLDIHMKALGLYCYIFLIGT